jgi:hypothetical protein
MEGSYTRQSHAPFLPSFCELAQHETNAETRGYRVLDQQESKLDSKGIITTLPEVSDETSWLRLVHLP